MYLLIAMKTYWSYYPPHPLPPISCKCSLANPDSIIEAGKEEFASGNLGAVMGVAQRRLKVLEKVPEFQRIFLDSCMGSKPCNTVFFLPQSHSALARSFCGSKWGCLTITTAKKQKPIAEPWL